MAAPACSSLEPFPRHLAKVGRTPCPVAPSVTDKLRQWVTEMLAASMPTSASRFPSSVEPRIQVAPSSGGPERHMHSVPRGSSPLQSVASRPVPPPALSQLFQCSGGRSPWAHVACDVSSGLYDLGPTPTPQHLRSGSSGQGSADGYWCRLRLCRQKKQTHTHIGLCPVLLVGCAQIYHS